MKCLDEFCLATHLGGRDSHPHLPFVSLTCECTTGLLYLKAASLSANSTSLQATSLSKEVTSIVCIRVYIAIQELLVGLLSVVGI